VFTSEGPAPFTIVSTSRPISAGAISTVVIDPKNADIVWIGAVNGGVWKTSDFQRENPSHAPTWQPLTDHMGSLSIAALSLDPTDDSARTLVAGFGRQSSGASAFGPLTGILRTTDGGSTWTPLGAADLTGENISGVAARGRIIIVASDGGTGGTGGIWRSTDTGSTFQRLSGTSVLTDGSSFPDGGATSLIGDASHANRLWAGIVGSGGGVFRSDDLGAHWTPISTTAVTNMATSARKVTLAERSYATGLTTVYGAIVDSNKNVPAIFKLSADSSISGDILSLPPFTVEYTSSLPPFETFSQGKVSLAADPTDPNQFFVAGDEGDLFRCVATPLLPICTSISDRTVAAGTHVHTASGTDPHPDSRTMVFDGDRVLLDTDDGGIFERTSPRSDDGDWFAKVGNLAITETYSCGYDNRAGVSLCGVQDNGVVQQQARGNRVWTQLLGTDGGDIAVSEATIPCLWDGSRSCSSRYYSRHDLANFSHVDCDATNHCEQDPLPPTLLGPDGKSIGCVVPSNKATCGDTDITGQTPMAADRLAANRIVIAADMVFESIDYGHSVQIVDGLSGMATQALVYGGRSQGTDNADLLYVGSTAGLFIRTARSGPLTATNWSVTKQGTPIKMSVDPKDWRSAWVASSGLMVWHTPDAGAPPAAVSCHSLVGTVEQCAVTHSVRAVCPPGPPAAIWRQTSQALAPSARSRIYLRRVAQLLLSAQTTASTSRPRLLQVIGSS
jgi:hypothetical protein